MASVQQHYARVLTDVYSWMFGGFENGVEINVRFFKRHDLRITGSGTAVDLGAGCGFQSIPLAKMGFDVLAIDSDAGLLDELATHLGNLPVKLVHDDLMKFDGYLPTKVEFIVCMTDTLLHLTSRDDITRLFRKVFDALERRGRFIATFRDLSIELSELDRFIPVRSDDRTILTCFLEYEPDRVKVHDLVYRKNGSGWSLSKSWYRKLRVSKAWVKHQLMEAGFREIDDKTDNELVSLTAHKTDQSA